MITQQSPAGAWRTRESRIRLIIASALLLLLGAASKNVMAITPGTYTIGAGTSYYGQYSTSPPSPLGWYYYNTKRVQYLYDTAALHAAGIFGAGYIDQIAFNVLYLQSSANVITQGFNVSMGLTTATTLTTASWATTSNVYSGTNIPTVGWNYISTNPTGTSTGGFYWDGVQNIVIDLCSFNINGSTVPYNGAGFAGVACVTNATGKSLYRYGSLGISLCNFSAFLPSAASTLPNLRIVKLAPCACTTPSGYGCVSAGSIIPGGTTNNVCPGSVFNLTDTGASKNYGIIYQWEVSTNGGTTWTPIPGATTTTLTTAPVLSSTRYRFRTYCTNSFPNDSSASSPVIFNVSSTSFPTYAALPFYEGFESWVNGCGSLDLPSYNWTTAPTSGNLSFRRNDQGLSNGGWTFGSSYTMLPPPDGTYAARINLYAGGAGSSAQGSMSAYVNCSASAGTKELRFWYDFNYPYWYSASYPGDEIDVDTSSNGGATWGLLTSVVGTPPGWNQVVVPFNSNSATTVIRFRAFQNYSYNYYDDIYIDKVQVLPACTGTPTAGLIDTILPCNGKSFKLNLTGTSTVAGLTYRWQYLPSGATGWADLPGGGIMNPIATITSNTQFRAIVTCSNSLLSDTSRVMNGILQPFYYCYCSFTPYYTNYSYGNIGNVLLTKASNGVALINNGVATPITYNTTATNYYTDFRRTLTPPTLIRDSLYRLQISAITSQYSIYTPYPANAWIDYNRDGIYQASERILNKNITSTTNPIAKDTFRIPDTAHVGITGLRASYFVFGNGTPTIPCGSPSFSYGEVEDYLVNIDYKPCNGPVGVGYASISDTIVCPGYGVDMWDTAYQTDRTGIVRGWQISTNAGASWGNIAGSAGRDTLLNVTIPRFNPTQYRFYVVCTNTNDTSFSNILNVSTPPSSSCYPVSQAIGGARDTSDIGSFQLGSFINPAPPATAGPHLYNPMAHRRRTDYTMLGPIRLDADSTYRLSVFQTMPGGIHADALVSVWIDFNHDQQYTAASTSIYPSELVYVGRTTPPEYYLDTLVTMPHNLINGVRTGVRVMLSNDLSLSPTNPIFVGSGLFTSGEVEDYVAIFGRVGLGVNSGTLLQNLALVPNPTDGRFNVISDATRTVSKMEVVVTTITGQQVMSRSFSNVGMHFSTELDLSGAAKGIYFVELRADGEKITRKLVVR